MAGVEVAGLVLGAFSLLMQGVQTLLASKECCHDIKDYRLVIQQFERDLRMEKCKFENTWYTLLAIAEQDPAALGNPPWDPNIIAKIMSPLKLRRDTIPAFNGACEELHGLLQKLDLEVCSRGKAGQVHFRPTYKKMLDALEVGFSKNKHSAQVDRMRQLNQDLETLVNGPRLISLLHRQPQHMFNPCIDQAGPSTQPAPSSISNTDVAGYYNKIRRKAIRFHSFLHEKSNSCSCPKSSIKVSNSHLQLEQRHITANKRSLDGHPPATCFSLVLPVLEDLNLSLGKNISNYKTRHYKWTALEFEELDREVGDANVARLPPTIPDPPDFRKAKVLKTTEQSYGQENAIISVNDTMLSASKSSEDTVSDVLKLPFRAPKPPNGKPLGSHLQAPTTSQPPHTHHHSMSPSPSLQSASAPFKSIRTKLKLLQTPSGKSSSVLVDQVMECLCLAISHRLAATNLAQSSVEILCENNNKLHQLRIPAGEQSLSKSTACKHSGFSSLKTLLWLSRPTRAERFRLGLTLASSVLQLHNTEWLSEVWTNQHIFFRTSTERPILDPFVKYCIGSPLDIATYPQPDILFSNKTLFCLGILLIEICFWKSLENIENSKLIQHNSGNDSWSSIEKYLTARQLLQDVYGEAGNRYGDVVRRCIHGFDYKETDLTHDGFKNEVFNKIIKPLEEILVDYCS